METDVYFIPDHFDPRRVLVGTLRDKFEPNENRYEGLNGAQRMIVRIVTEDDLVDWHDHDMLPGSCGSHFVLKKRWTP